MEQHLPKTYRKACTSVGRRRLIISTHSVPSAIVELIAPNPVFHALADTIPMIPTNADTFVTTVRRRRALGIHVALGWIGRAVGYDALVVHDAVARVAGALVASTGVDVRAPLVLFAVRVIAALVCVCKAKL